MGYSWLQKVALAINVLVVGGCAVSAAQDAASDSTLKQISQNEMTFAYEFTEELLTGRVSAPTDGWLAVGFNRPGTGLAGARLLMMRVMRGEAEGETHVADPPRHYPRSEVLGWDPLQVTRSEVVRGAGGVRTTIWFQTALAGEDGMEPTIVDGPMHLVLAYSNDKDYFHHSVMRVGIEAEL